MPDVSLIKGHEGTDVLVRAGLRATSPRLAIWQALCEAADEPDAVELLRRANLIEPRTSLGTVYRFLRELEQRGLAVSRPVAHQRARWRASAGKLATASRDSAAISAVARLAAAFGYQLVPTDHATPTD